MAEEQDQAVEQDQVKEVQSDADLAKQIEEKFKKEIAGLNRRISQEAQEKEELRKAKEDLELQGMSEAERATAELQKLKTEKEKLAKEVEAERMKHYRAVKVNDLKLPSWVADRLTGATEAEIDEDAEKFAAALGDFWEEETARKYKGRIPRIAGEGDLTWQDLQDMTDAEIQKLDPGKVAEIVGKGQKK